MAKKKLAKACFVLETFWEKKTLAKEIQEDRQWRKFKAEPHYLESLVGDMVVEGVINLEFIPKSENM